MIIGSNFKLSNRKFLDDRQQYEGLSELNLNKKGYLFPLGFEVYCVREGKWYQNVSTDKNVPLWEERKGNGSLDIDDVIADGEVLSNKTWSSEYIDSFKTNIETLIIDNEDYIAEIEDRVLFIEGQFHWLESFDGSYNSLTDKPTIPTRTSELINDAGFAPYSELDSSGIFELKHYHDNKDLLDTITEERVAQWDSNSENSFGGDYNYLDNKPLTYLGDDSDIVINFANVNSGNYMVNGTIGDYALANELTFIEKTDKQIIVTLPRMSKMITLELVNGIWTKINEVNYQVDKDNANISNSLNIGTNNIVGENNQIVQGKYNVEDTEGKYVNIVGNGEDENNRKNIHTLDWEGNAWYNGKVSQEGTPTEDKDLVTKGYVDGKFATSERVEKYIEDNNKENARRDVIIDALANGRRRTIDYVDGETDLFYATEKDDIFIDKIEGETLVNVCDQEEPIAITKSYTVENTNHVALQGEYDGKCRPVVYGNTLVNRNVEYDKSMVIGNTINENGTEVNIVGTVNSEIEVSLDGHTALNLGTKKGGELCKSFESASGNEIKLTTDGNSKTDIVCQGNTMVNLCNSKSSGSTTSGIKTYYFKQNLKGRKVTLQINMGDLDTTYMGWAIYRRNSDSTNVGSFISYNDDFSIRVVDFSTDNATDFDNYVLFIRNYNGSEYIDFDCTKIKINVFEGDLTQTPHLIPTEYVKGIQSTFEDKYIPYSIYNGDNLTSITETQYQLPLTVKTNTTYTVITTINTTKYQYAIYSQDSLSEYLAYENTLSTAIFSSDKANISFKVRMNPSYEGEDYNFVLDEVKDKFLIVEGDFSGRENLLTSEYFGKYKVDMQSVGKNLFDGKNITIGRGINETTGQLNYPSDKELVCCTDYIKIKPNTTYTTNCQYYRWYAQYDKNKNSIGGTTGSQTFTTKENACYVRLTLATAQKDTFQLEEGTVATEYEPYYGTTKTVYLNSPLYEGDELLTKDGKIYHYHKMGSVVLDGSENWTKFSEGSLFNTETAIIQIELWGKDVNNTDINIFSDNFIGYSASYIWTNDIEGICYNATGTLQIRISKSKLATTDIDGFKQWLQANPTTVVYKLAEPYYEDISITDDMIFDIATSSTLSYESAVPMGTTSFLPYTNELPLLETSTQYRVSFDCDVVGLPLVISLGGTTTTITSELHNTLSIITPSIETNGKLTIDGSGMANIDNVVVTKGEMVYEYFEGLKSSFENTLFPSNYNNLNLFDYSKMTVTEGGKVENEYLIYDSQINMSNRYSGYYYKDFSRFEVSTEYVVIVDIIESNMKDTDCILYVRSEASTQNGDPDIMESSDGRILNIDVGRYIFIYKTLSNFDLSKYVLRTLIYNPNFTKNLYCKFKITIYKKKYYTTLTLTTNNNNNLIFGKGGRL